MTGLKKFIKSNYYWIVIAVLLPVLLYLRVTRGRSLIKRRREGFQNILVYPERPAFKPRSMEPLKEVTSTAAIREALKPITEANQLREVQAALAAMKPNAK